MNLRHNQIQINRAWSQIVQAFIGDYCRFSYLPFHLLITFLIRN
nr:photosystem II protein L [Aleuritopteris squamosa]WLF85369.1 photosystem II protein L [Aleuritopteris squamosa]